MVSFCKGRQVLISHNRCQVFLLPLNRANKKPAWWVWLTAKRMVTLTNTRKQFGDDNGRDNVQRFLLRANLGRSNEKHFQVSVLRIHYYLMDSILRGPIHCSSYTATRRTWISSPDSMIAMVWTSRNLRCLPVTMHFKIGTKGCQPSLTCRYYHWTLSFLFRQCNVEWPVDLCTVAWAEFWSRTKVGSETIISFSLEQGLL